MTKLWAVVAAILALAVAGRVLAQNLVPNPSFETYSSCPTFFIQLSRATPWTQVEGSSDYFNACATAAVGVPTNNIGYQAAHTGNGYAGIFTYQPGSIYREYIQAPLLSPLVSGEAYHVSFYASLADATGKSVDGLGAYLSVGPVMTSNLGYLPFTPQVANPVGNILTDYQNWTLIEGNFVASGGENYIVIGNFNDDAHTQLGGGPALGNNGYHPYSYYYIDDVSVVPLGVLKVCKIAGPGISQGERFTFATGINGSRGPSATAQAGPAPGGYCNVVGSFPQGSTVTVSEVAMTGVQVNGISVSPSNRLVNDDLNQRAVTVTIGAGVTEATFTNARVLAGQGKGILPAAVGPLGKDNQASPTAAVGSDRNTQTGYLEICKAGNVSGTFTFAITGAGQVTVPAGACSPAFLAPAGNLTITELQPGGSAWLPLHCCKTFPPDRQVAHDDALHTSTVTVVQGDVSTETIAYITNYTRQP